MFTALKSLVTTSGNKGKQLLMKYDLLHIQGKPYVLVPLHEYRSMVTSGDGDNLPDDVLDSLAARQQSPLRILRDHRGYTQNELAERADLSRTYLTEIERGRKDGSIRALRALAEALDVNVSLLAA